MRRGLAVLAALWASLAVPSAGSAFDPHGWGLLEDGGIGQYRWTVQAKREGAPARAGSGGGRPPCILVGVKREQGPFTYHRVRFQACADRPGRLRPADGPLIATSSIAGADGRSGMTAVGALAAPAVRRLRITQAGGRVEAVRLLPLTREQAARTGLGRARYAAFPVRGLWTAERVVALSGGNRVVWDSGAAAPEGVP